ncbi:cobalt-precorrin-5B (C(1))-methyltransferase CbiD [Ihubacter massiliensis]|uniref:Cobalt-precorrin-5B C(1)-methyltransferase n=1 Tax=Hominibacterium faecale TaxID=2839743 RepID=A0A9J6QWY4_9FIRM|nr:MULTISPECIES: cobalt-precorrin-5B (C(1))-methyltransferase CbiD [Eubacteriales Family XIII. Incertae Sedis]MCO7120667.1 cobalt-precorrin-5B (C(1))-methyltransferase CbiD [Ihubacter massiliensis]MCU7379968.1 cobalt-precorrin-5B (C(1))-methyltransferase CbiD [Hominibacterium faecale]
MNTPDRQWKTIMELYVEKENKRLRRGFTTGTCAAAAACGAAQALLSEGQMLPCEIKIQTPKGIQAKIPVESIRIQEEGVLCSVRKDSGDDPDVTDGTMICALVQKLEGQSQTVIVDGGRGVGRLTKPGLACQVGEAAINPIPRKMIETEVRKVAGQLGYKGGLHVEISVPEGEALAEKTFNPKLGIVGGLSILGTSGIVEPMSEQALIDTIKVEINMKKAAGVEYLVVTPGNYGETFLKETRNLDQLDYVKCSNFIGDTLSYLKEQDFKGVLLAGHIGKLVKVAAGMMNTHSKYGDRRMETLAEHAALAGVSQPQICQIRECVTTENAAALIKGCGPEMEKRIYDSLLREIKANMDRQVNGCLQTEVILFSSKYGYLGETPGTGQFLLRAQASGGK